MIPGRKERRGAHQIGLADREVSKNPPAIDVRRGRERGGERGRGEGERGGGRGGGEKREEGGERRGERGGGREEGGERRGERGGGREEGGGGEDESLDERRRARKTCRKRGEGGCHVTEREEETN